MLDIQFQTRANIRTIEYAWQLVSAGVGAALLPKWQEIIDADVITFKPIQHINFFKEIGLTYKEENKNHPIVTALNDICTN